MTAPLSRLPAPYHLHRLTGAALTPWLDAVAALRITVFRDWPYLYEGDLGYERDYLARYRDCPRAIVGLVECEGRPVGATTGLPLTDAAPEMQAPFHASGIDLAPWFYCGESVLLPTARGQGIGRAFFELREAHARALGLTHSTFCAVERHDNHPLKPAAYRGNDRLWQGRGYQRQPGLQCRYRWRDIGADTEDDKQLTFWTRSL
ncbi:GNAT family N-acetyltransferase [Flagellatimonas centrodinii]|uniref:GNAT family N-acetyltransferase n=1 Tax=Flagellatimonas centrodinii TaxID=2806210 RepID=UPI001FEEB434|nr:GNAT family N-acetyltransferase [Flagellatimonas centrodinii]ULQ45446.1 GNAT family N-acetyltransferase [Flagellatimonas centrodinii]